MIVNIYVISWFLLLVKLDYSNKDILKVKNWYVVKFIKEDVIIFKILFLLLIWYFSYGVGCFWVLIWYMYIINLF